MKTLSGTLKYVSMAIGVVAFVVACATYVSRGSGVEMGQYYATIYPDAKVSGADCKALIGVLSHKYKHKEYLWEIRTYKDGEQVAKKGDIAQKYIREGLVSEVTKKAQATKFSGCAIQAGSTNEVSKASTTRQNIIPMINDLRPILEKYNKK